MKKDIGPFSKELPPPAPLPRAKRFFDVIVSAAALVLLSPLFLVIALAILLEGVSRPASRGPIFYSEIRISRGEPFRLRKFRIFKKAALADAREQSGVIHTKDLEQNQYNLTTVGCWLKQVYLDELPQLFNIFLGDMTFVGPRPTNLDNVRKLAAGGQYSKLIFRAGLTGYFQSHKGQWLAQGQDNMDMAYINFCASRPGWRVVLYDLKILLITARTILRAEGR